MNKVKDCLRDTLRAVCGGAVFAAIFSVILIAGGFLFTGFHLAKAFQVLRSGLFIAGGLTLLVAAGLLIYPRGGRKIEEHPAWKRHFRVLNLATAVMLADLVVLGWAFAVDYMLFYS